MVKIYKLSEDPHKDEEAHRYSSPLPSRMYILQLLKDSQIPLNIQKIAKAFQLTTEDSIAGVRKRLRAMERAGQIIKNRRGGYGIVDKMGLVKGRIIGHRDGYGFIATEEEGSDLFLSPYQMKKAMHGDRVLAHVINVDYRGRREGEVVEILEYANEDIVGKLVQENGVYILIPDNKKITQVIMVDPDRLGKAQIGQIVIVQLKRTKEISHAMIGEVKQVLGDELQPGLEIEIAISNHALPHEWSTEVLKEIKHFNSKTISEELLKNKNRKDFRDLPFITIDGEDAKDFDDAVFVTALPKEQLKLYVAIADVSYYVPLDTALDKEAYLRGTSVYFPGKVIPMLPSILSDDLCSLKPEVDRLCLVAILTIDSKGKLIDSEFQEAVIHSKARLTYTQVNDIIINNFAESSLSSTKWFSSLKDLFNLYKVLRSQREKRGAIDFETVETRFILDQNSKVKEIIPLLRNDAHKLIEECMIFANVVAANFLISHELVAPYRIHEIPPENKIEDVNQFLREFGLSMGNPKQPIPKNYDKILKKIKDKPYYSIVQTVLLRSLSQAQYSPRNIGHFGLALDCYTHFTSPIRRYPDLLVHRVLRSFIQQGSKNFSQIYETKKMVEMTQYCSYSERRADDATREVEARLKCEYMKNHINKEFKGIISGGNEFWFIR